MRAPRFWIRPARGIRGLRQRLEELLRAAPEADDFFGRRAVNLHQLPPLSPDDVTIVTAPAEQEGERIGRERQFATQSVLWSHYRSRFPRARHHWRSDRLLFSTTSRGSPRSTDKNLLLGFAEDFVHLLTEREPGRRGCFRLVTAAARHCQQESARSTLRLVTKNRLTLIRNLYEVTLI